MNPALNSLATALAATVLALLFGFSAALLNLGLSRSWRYILFILAIVALAVPPFLATNCWLHYLGQTGVWHSWLPLNIFSLGGCVWILSLLTWPISFFLIDSAWRRLEPAMLELDPLLRGRHLFSMLLLPLARPAMLQAGVLTFILALNNFAVPAILQIKVAPAEAWIRFNTEFDSIGALKLSWVNIIVPLLLLFWLSTKQVSWPKTALGLNPSLARRQLGYGWYAAAALATLFIVILSAGLPIFQLLSVKRTWTEFPGAIAAGTSAIVNSVIYSAGGAALVVLFAIVWRTIFLPSVRRPNGVSGGTTPVGLQPSAGMPRTLPKSRDCRDVWKASNLAKRLECRASRRSRWPKQLASALVWTPFLIPGVVLGIGLIAAFNHDWSNLFYQSIAIVLTAYCLRYFAPGWAAVSHAWRSADPALLEAAGIEGASRWQVFRYALWPQIYPAVAAAWYIVFLLCLWDVEALILIVPPGGETLSLRIFNFLHYGHNAQVNALCLALLAVAVLPLMVAALALRARDVLWQGRRLASNVNASKNSAILFASTLLLLITSGCGHHYRENEAPIPSTIFSSVQIIGSRGVGVGQLNKPRSVAVDKQDNLYVIDMTGRVQKFSPEGKFLLSWQMPQTDLGKPKGMTRDLAGNIVVLEPHYQRVNHFSTEGKLVAQWGRRGTNEGEFMLPRAIAINSHNEIFVSEYSSMERVQKFQLSSNLNAPGASAKAGSDSGTKDTPTLLLAFGKPGNAPGEFNRAEGLFVDKQDQLYVADSCNHRIQVFSRDGKFITAYGSAGSAPGEFSYPYDVCVDSEGLQFVSEFGNSRIQIFDAAHHSIEITGKPGSEPGEFSNPWGLALDSRGDLYVADSQNHRVQKFIRRKPLTIAHKNLSTVSAKGGYDSPGHRREQNQNMVDHHEPDERAKKRGNAAHSKRWRAACTILKPREASGVRRIPPLWAALHLPLQAKTSISIFNSNAEH